MHLRFVSTVFILFYLWLIPSSALACHLFGTITPSFLREKGDLKQLVLDVGDLADVRVYENSTTRVRLIQLAPKKSLPRSSEELDRLHSQLEHLSSELGRPALVRTKATLRNWGPKALRYLVLRAAITYAYLSVSLPLLEYGFFTQDALFLRAGPMAAGMTAAILGLVSTVKLLVFVPSDIAWAIYDHYRGTSDFYDNMKTADDLESFIEWTYRGDTRHAFESYVIIGSLDASPEGTWLGSARSGKAILEQHSFKEVKNFD